MYSFLLHPQNTQKSLMIISHNTNIPQTTLWEMSLSYFGRCYQKYGLWNISNMYSNIIYAKTGTNLNIQQYENSLDKPLYPCKEILYNHQLHKMPRERGTKIYTTIKKLNVRHLHYSPICHSQFAWLYS